MVARDAGAKVVLVGDPEQLQAIEAGAALRALTRHREGVALHYGVDDFAREQADVARVLGRERPKDTTLDYAQGFAERRGIVPARDGIEVRARERARG